MIEAFAKYAIAHESGHCVVGQFVKIAAPFSLSFRLDRGSDGELYLGDFATSFLFPPDDEIANLPPAVKNCLCYTLAAGFAATQFSGLSLPDERKGLDSDRIRLAKLTSESLEHFVPYATAVIRQEQRAYERVMSECTKKYEQLKQANVDEGNHILLRTEDLTALFNRAMSPLRATLPSTENTTEFHVTMSAHEAGHATVGIALGARIEAVYAVIREKLPNGNFSVGYLTKFGALAKRGLGVKDQILLTAGGAAGERLLNGTWDHDCVARDRTDLEEMGFPNFDYCVEQATHVLQENEILLSAVRDKIKARMSDLKSCKLTKNGSHIILSKGPEIEKLFRALGVSVDSSKLDPNTARLRVSCPGRPMPQASRRTERG